jgi:hypothetical protein
LVYTVATARATIDFAKTPVGKQRINTLKTVSTDTLRNPDTFVVSVDTGNERTMQNYHWMDTKLKRAIGAQFKSNLKGEIMVFSYPHPAAHLFHTMWCPPLRIVVVNAQPEEGKVVFDQVVKPGRFVNLPAGNLVLEMDPNTEYTEVLPSILSASQKRSRIPDNLPVGGTDSSISIHLMIYQMFADSLCDLRKVKDNCLTQDGTVNYEKLKKKYAPWDRGQIYASAGFVLDYSADSTWSLPSGVFHLSKAVLQCEQEYADEILAAMSGAVPSWRLSLRAVCIGCGRGGTWRSILPVPADTPPEVSWRLLRPENHIPICKYFARRYVVHRKPQIRLELASAFWGARFSALEFWYECARGLNGGLPEDWNKGTHPLWPDTFGGDTWETGSGATIHTTPAWPQKVQRTPEQIEYLKRVADWDVIANGKASSVPSK